MSTSNQRGNQSHCRLSPRKTAARSYGSSRRRSRSTWSRPWMRTRLTSGYRPATWTSWSAVPSVTVVLTAIALTRHTSNEDCGTAGSSTIRVLTRWHRPSGGISIPISSRIITITITTHHRHSINLRDYSLDHFPPVGSRDRSILDLESSTPSLLITIEERATTCTYDILTKNEHRPAFMKVL